MKRNLKLLFILAAFALAAVPVLVTCTNAVPPGNTVEQAYLPGHGNLVLGDGSRSLLASDLEYATVTISGYDMTDIVKSGNALTNKRTSSAVAITNIPVGKNRVVKVEGFKNSTGVAGAVMYALTDIVEGNSNSVTVNWPSTPLGGVYAGLLGKGYDISSMTAAEKTTISTTITNLGASHGSLVNSGAIATDYPTLKTGTAAQTAYLYSSGTVTFTLNGSASNLTAQVTDPSSGVSSSVAVGSNTLSAGSFPEPGCSTFLKTAPRSIPRVLRYPRAAA
ncbi:hypothetical protein K7I13_04840 [Brucepastera parasyntrophica]|uniref:hypothetical protein n=1 Tax=Brucepastera parasyntrophica TaxID=2880008 RepID=UPI00210EAF9B|nr:hypothetical protein [Brucepastera parasyntrophica]ULQ60610.1 hypothetical protein K7I13_04840 [Brucepastera parasyntrophica]